MKKLRCLTVYNYLNEGDMEGPDFLSNELRYMSWEMYPPSLFPKSFQPRKLVVLKLDKSLQKEIWRGYKLLECLEELQLRSAPNLVRTPDLGGLPCLQKLALSDCNNLAEIHKSLGTRSSLVDLNLLRLPSMPDHLPCFIRRLTLSQCGLLDRKIPSDIRELSNLQELDLSYNMFSRFNFSLSQLTRLKLLNLRCCMLVELPKLPTSLAILKADGCSFLEVIGDIHTNCKWLCQVSLRFGGSLIGGNYLLQTMLRGNAIENICMCLHLKGLQIPNEFTPPLLLKGSRFRLQLPEHWYNRYSGFLMCATLREDSNSRQLISMKHDNGSWMSSDSHWEEGNDDVETWVGYVSFGSLKDTLWWDSTSTAIEFSFEYESESCSGFGVRLVSKRSQMETTITDSSESFDDYSCNFSISHDSKSDLKCLFSTL